MVRINTLQSSINLCKFICWRSFFANTVLRYTQMDIVTLWIILRMSSLCCAWEVMKVKGIASDSWWAFQHNLLNSFKLCEQCPFFPGQFSAISCHIFLNSNWKYISYYLWIYFLIISACIVIIAWTKHTWNHYYSVSSFSFLTSWYALFLCITSYYFTQHTLSALSKCTEKKKQHSVFLPSGVHSWKFFDSFHKNEGWVTELTYLKRRCCCFAEDHKEEKQHKQIKIEDLIFVVHTLHLKWYLPLKTVSTCPQTQNWQWGIIDLQEQCQVWHFAFQNENLCVK